MDQPPELSPEDKAYVDDKTRRMVAVAALRRIQRLVHDYRNGGTPLELRGPGDPRELPPDLRAAVPPHARRVAGFAAMLKVQQLARQYREEQAAARRAAKKIALFFIALCIAGMTLYLVAPATLQALLRVLS
jgi:hypothetical protein